MRVLMLSRSTPYLPTHERARRAPAHLLEQLSGRHTFALVAPAARAETPAQRAWAADRVQRFTQPPAGPWRPSLTGTSGDGLGAMRAAALRTVREWAPDVVHLDGAALAPLAAMLPAPAVVAGRAAGVAPRRRRGPAAWVVTSEQERQVLAEHVPFGRIDVIPPGLDEIGYEFRRTGESARLIFAGNLAWPAHLDAARRLARRVLPRVRRTLPRAELLLVGGGTASELRMLAALPGVRIAGAVTDLRPSLWSAAVTVVPAEAGAGVDAAVLESMALGTPVVAARRALAGLTHLLPGHHALVAGTDSELVDAVLLILREPVVAATLAANARTVIERQYTWSAIARCYESLWARTADGATTAVAA
jgi:glycosyltransferase involved in cell wall biosynthesis